ncbi:MAG TPA: hypothetical protein ENF75_03385 [Acidilobales archaeon]|nr:hypothetical protein [Acidilobales archaeon]
MKRKRRTLTVFNLDFNKILRDGLENLALLINDILSEEVDKVFKGIKLLEVEPAVSIDIDDALNIVLDIEVRSPTPISPEVELKIDEVMTKTFRRVENELLTKFIKE